MLLLQLAVLERPRGQYPVVRVALFGFSVCALDKKASLKEKIM